MEETTTCTCYLCEAGRCVKKKCIIGREGHPQPGVDLFNQISDQKVRTGLKRSNVFEAIYSR